MCLRVICPILGVFLGSVCFAAEITDLKYGESADAFRLEISASDHISVQASVLDGPNRLVIKFPGSRISGTLPQPPRDHPLFSQVKSESQGDNGSLIVDLKQPSTFTQSWEPVSYGNSPTLRVDFPKFPLAERAGRAPGGKSAGKARAVLVSSGKSVVNQKADASEIERLRRALAEQQRTLDLQRKAFEEQQRKLQALQKQLDRLAGGTPVEKTAVDQNAPKEKPAKVRTADSVKVADNQQRSAPKGPVGQAPEPVEKPKPPELPRISRPWVAC